MRLCASDLGCRRGGRVVFAGVAFSVASGETLLVSGRNGAGKSSLLRVIAGLVRVLRGKLQLEGGDPEATLGEQAHYLGHQDALKSSLSVRENLQFWASFLGGRTGDVDGALAAMDLDGLAELPAAYLSAGQRRRLSIARLLAVRRPIWLLDEPTSTLDAGAQHRLTALMRTHLGEGGLILAASHGPIGIDASHELRLGQSGLPSQLEGFAAEPNGALTPVRAEPQSTSKASPQRDGSAVEP